MRRSLSASRLSGPLATWLPTSLNVGLQEYLHVLYKELTSYLGLRTHRAPIVLCSQSQLRPPGPVADQPRLQGHHQGLGHVVPLESVAQHARDLPDHHAECAGPDRTRRRVLRRCVPQARLFLGLPSRVLIFERPCYSRRQPREARRYRLQEGIDVALLVRVFSVTHTPQNAHPSEWHAALRSPTSTISMVRRPETRQLGNITLAETFATVGQVSIALASTAVRPRLRAVPLGLGLDANCFTEVHRAIQQRGDDHQLLPSPAPWTPDVRPQPTKCQTPL